MPLPLTNPTAGHDLPEADRVRSTAVAPTAHNDENAISAAEAAALGTTTAERIEDLRADLRRWVGSCDAYAPLSICR